ncbi:hypothetical protein EIP86_007300 [Pleurotus ostreatoroseus]|nr:hypothetical protein EIP86_007300 [Pleurotus ostreatoroseus]
MTSGLPAARLHHGCTASARAHARRPLRAHPLHLGHRLAVVGYEWRVLRLKLRRNASQHYSMWQNESIVAGGVAEDASELSSERASAVTEMPACGHETPEDRFFQSGSRLSAVTTSNTTTSSAEISVLYTKQRCISSLAYRCIEQTRVSVVMTCLPCTVVATIERVLPPSEYNLEPLCIAEAEERARIVAEERSLVQQLQALMREEAQLKQKIYKTRSRFNAVAYISRLPAEALSAILEALVSDHWERYYPLVRPSRSVRAYQVTPYEWIKTALHVCRQWRSVALSTPRLWTCIAHDRLYQTWRLNFLLEHSGNLPLTLRNGQSLEQDPARRDDSSVDEDGTVIHKPPGSKFFETVLSQFQRIEVLATDCPENTYNLGDFIEAKKDEDGALDAPLMRHLGLDLSQTGTHMKTMLCSINMPSLRTLILSNASLELVQRLSCSSLTSFHVTFEDNVDTTKLLDLFENLPVLRKLLVDCIISDDDSDTSRGVSLRFLEFLHLEGTADGVTQLLNQLIFPSNTVVELKSMQGLPGSLLASIMPTVLGHTSPSADLPNDPAGAVRLMRPYTIVLASRSSSKTVFTRFPKLEKLYINSKRDTSLAATIFEKLITLARTSASSIPSKPADNGAQDGPSNNDPTALPSTHSPLPALKRVILHRLTIEFKGPDDNEVDWRDGDIYTQLRCYGQLGFKLRVLELTKAHLLTSIAPETAAGIVRDALLDLNIADEVKVTARE